MSEERAEYKTIGEGLTAGVKKTPKITNLEHYAVYTAMLALLKRLQWSQSQEGRRCCPVCYGYEEARFHQSGHLNGCELGQLIQVLEAVTEKEA